MRIVAKRTELRRSSKGPHVIPTELKDVSVSLIAIVKRDLQARRVCGERPHFGESSGALDSHE